MVPGWEQKTGPHGPSKGPGQLGGALHSPLVITSSLRAAVEKVLGWNSAFTTRVSTASSEKSRVTQRPCLLLRSKGPGHRCTDQGASLQVGPGTCAVHLITPGPPQDGRSRTISPALPPLSISSQTTSPCTFPEPGPCWGLCTQLWGADVRHQAQARLFTCTQSVVATLWTHSSSVKADMTTLRAAALSSINLAGL